MLPFLKNRQDASASMPTEKVEREHDEDFDMLDVVAQDILDAVKKSDKAALKEALSAFMDHMQDQDEQQDQNLLGA